MTKRAVTGKVVTLPRGEVVTVLRRSSPWTHRVRSDNGKEFDVIDRVLRELPVTHRRADL